MNVGKFKLPPKLASSAAVPATAADFFAAASSSSGSNDRTREVPMSQIRTSPYQHRKQKDQEHIESLAESILATRQIQPILVRALDDGFYELLAGEHRFHAMLQLGRSTILATVHQASNAEAQVMVLVENLKRKDVADYEAGVIFKTLLDSKEVESPSAMARMAGVKRQYVYRAMALANLPKEITRQLDEHPYAIGGHAGDDLRSLVANEQTALAAEAVKRVIEGKLKQGDVATWARAQLKGAATMRKPIFVCADQRIRGTITTKGNRIALNLTCDKNLPAEAVIRIQAAVEKMMRGLSMPDLSDVEMFRP